MSTTASGRPDGPASYQGSDSAFTGAKASARSAPTTGPSQDLNQGLGQGSSQGPSLGRRLRIRSMVNMAGEVLPFFWPMRNFIHHNPLHGLEHLPFEQAVAEASHLFHARGYLRRVEYQQLMQCGSIEPEVIDELVAEFVNRWLAEHDGGAAPELADLLHRCLLAMVRGMNQPAPGDDVPCAEEVLAGMRRRG